MEDHQPFFSIIIPVRNGAGTIARAIDSVRRQRVDDLELIVVVNASSDQTADIVNAASQTDPRIRVLSEPKAGRSRARNLGIRHSRGSWLIFLDADDELGVDRLANALEAMAASPTAAAIQCGTVYLRDGRIEHRIPAYQGADFYSVLRLGNLVPINSMTIRRTAVTEFPLELEYCEDWVFWLRSLRGIEIASDSAEDAVVHLHEQQTSTAKSAMRGWELAVSINDGSAGLPLALRAKRRWRQFVDLVLYRDGEDIPEVEDAIAHGGLSWLDALVECPVNDYLFAG